jgi:hypothetical protein
LSVEEPGWDLVLGGILNDGDDSLEFFRCDLTGPDMLLVFRSRTLGGHEPLVQIHIGFLAHQVGVSPAHALDPRQGIHDLLLSIDIGV